MEIDGYERIHAGDLFPVKLTKILAYMRYYQTTTGLSPTIREIQNTLGISSTSLTQYYLHRLVELGRVKQIEAGKRRGYIMLE